MKVNDNNNKKKKGKSSRGKQAFTIRVRLGRVTKRKTERVGEKGKEFFFFFTRMEGGSLLPV